MALQLFEARRRKTGDLFELGRQMGDAAISKFKGHFVECILIVNEPFLYFLDLLLNKKLLDRCSLYRGEYIAQVVVVLV